MEIVILIKDILKEKGMDQKELAMKTGLTERTISELCNNKTERLPKTALTKIAVALEIKDISKIMELQEKS